MKTMNRVVIAVMLSSASLVAQSGPDVYSTVYDGDLNYQGQVYGGEVYDEDNNYRGYQTDDGDLYDGDLNYRGSVYGDRDASVILLED